VHPDRERVVAANLFSRAFNEANNFFFAQPDALIGMENRKQNAKWQLEAR